MRKWGQCVFVAVVATGLLGGARVWGQAPQPAESAPTTKGAMAAKPMGQLNINTADEAALTPLKGVGEVRAKAIIAYRQEHGPFKSVDDLVKVKGIGEKIVADLRNQLTVE